MMRKRKGYKVYPLTVAQKFHLYYLPFCPSAAVLNIGTSLTIEIDIDWQNPSTRRTPEARECVSVWRKIRKAPIISM